MTHRFDRRDFMKTGLAALGAATAAGLQPAAAQPSTDLPVIYFNGQILTMEGERPQYVPAVAVRGGRIVFVGTRQAALAAVGRAMEVDLQGRTMLPGFIDSWGHFALFAQQTLGVNLAYFSEQPPRTKADAIGLLKRTKPFNGWVIGYGIVDTQLSDGPLTLADLDAAFPDLPVMVSTLSTLTGQVNTAGMNRLGLTPQTPVTQPGQIVKDPATGRLTGELLFTPFLAARAQAVGRYTQAQALQTFQAAQALLAAQGYTTVQSYQLTPDDVANLRAAFDQGALALDVIGMPSVSDEATGRIVQQADWRWGAYSHGDRGLKIPGFQVATDAAPQLGLAAFSQPYADAPGFPKGWKGVLIAQDQVERWVRYAYEQDIQLFLYSNGDAGIDLGLGAIEKAIAATGKTGDRRTVIAHSYFVRPDQLDRYRQHHVGASMMPPHMMVYGEQLMTLLGPARATMESPLASALQRGLHTTIHCDCPSASPNMLQTVGAAVTRRTLAGQVMGPQERVSPYAALCAATRNVAYTYREEAHKGTISVGKQADLVILDANPLTVAPERIQDIRVVETLKRGQTIYRRS